MGLEVVHVGAVAVDLLADVVAGAVDEAVAVTGVVDHLAAGGVDLPALEGPAGRVGLRMHRIAASRARRRSGRSRILLGHRRQRSDAIQIAVEREWPVHPGPEVNEYEVSRLDGGVAARDGLVMRVAACGRHRRSAGYRCQAALWKAHDRRLDLGLAVTLPPEDAVATSANPGILDVVAAAAARVDRLLPGVPARLEMLDQVPRGDDLEPRERTISRCRHRPWPHTGWRRQGCIPWPRASSLRGASRGATRAPSTTGTARPSRALPWPRGARSRGGSRPARRVAARGRTSGACRSAPRRIR